MSKAKKKQVGKEQERVIKDMVEHGFAPVDSAGTMWCRTGKAGTTLLKRCDDGSWKCFSLADNGGVSTFEGLPDEAIVDLYCSGGKRDAGGKPDKDAIIAKLMDAAFSIDDDDEDVDERIEEKPYEYSEDGVDTTHELYREDFDVLQDAVEQAAAAMKKDDREAFLDALIEVYWKLDSCEVYDDDDEDDYDDEDDDNTARCCCGRCEK